tara:strand:+ start:143 stop:295 length:153 start_codon:yes stop_codon:yes gene_type:complete
MDARIGVGICHGKIRKRVVDGKIARNVHIVNVKKAARILRKVLDAISQIV